MLEHALVFIKVDPTKDKNVLSMLKARGDVKNVSYLYGPYDAYFELFASSLTDLENLITNVIRKIPGVRSSMTCFIAD